ncbi:MAG: UDP-N-acetylglucosamine 2-epimerase, partial [Oscillospiraceae bacterium]|nr:UDP-N-acetylglucosamine 2-epimerase [Oscillospiraceae bacterium]
MPTQKKIMLVFGTRPEAIKMCPLVLEMRQRAQFRTIVCVTGQHREMLDTVLEAFAVTPDHDLSIMGSEQTLFDVTQKAMMGMRDVLLSEKPDIVLVHGDTTTTYAAALACFYLDIAIGHVEAGLRTYNLRSPFPEEFYRQSVGIIA